MSDKSTDSIYQGKQDRLKHIDEYKHKQSAICVVLYDYAGGELSAEAQQEIEDAVLQVALKHNLLINVTIS